MAYVVLTLVIRLRCPYCEHEFHWVLPTWGTCQCPSCHLDFETVTGKSSYPAVVPILQGQPDRGLY